MKEQILKLRAEGKTYNEIQKELGCSKSTISYHCGEGQKEKNKLRTIKYRKTFEVYLFKRILWFQKRDDKNKNYDKSKSMTFTVKDFLDKFGRITKCALTGLEINLEVDRNWDIDHIIPKSRGGTNSLDNCQILLRDVNNMKNGLDEEKLINYCRLILKYKMPGREEVISPSS